MYIFLSFIISRHWEGTYWHSSPWKTRTHLSYTINNMHDDVIKWKHFPRYWPFVRGIHRSPVNSPHKGQWRGALMFTLICVRINGWVNNREAGDLRRYRAHYDVIVMGCWWSGEWSSQGIDSHDIDVIFKEYSGRGSRESGVYTYHQLCDTWSAIVMCQISLWF